jgi:hypothetical protein
MAPIGSTCATKLSRRAVNPSRKGPFGTSIDVAGDHAFPERKTALKGAGTREDRIE